jgi:hypothetical protein
MKNPGLGFAAGFARDERDEVGEVEAGEDIAGADGPSTLGSVAPVEKTKFEVQSEVASPLSTRMSCPGRIPRKVTDEVGIVARISGDRGTPREPAA